MRNVKFAWNAEFEYNAADLTDFFIQKLRITHRVGAFELAASREVEIALRPEQEDSEKFNRYQKAVRQWTIEITRAIHSIKEELRNNNPGAQFSSLMIEDGEHEFQLSDVVVRFTRYEGKRIIILVFDCLSTPEVISEKWLTNAQAILNLRLEDMFGDTLQSNFQVKTKFDQSAEFHRIHNPVPIIIGECQEERIFDSSFREIESTIQFHDQNEAEVRCLRRTSTTYLSDSDKIYYNQTKSNRDELNNYVRLHKTVYFLAITGNTPLLGDSFDEAGNLKRSELFDKIHTEFLFFSRGHHYETKFEATYKSIQFLDELIRLFNEQWGRIRTAYFVSPKFSISNRSSTSKNFFYLLEINAQINAMITRIKFELEGQHNSMVEAFERPLFTIKQQNFGNEEETEYYVDLSNTCQKPFLVFNQKRQALEESFDRISGNVTELRSDFDSNTNIMLQSLVFLFSVTMVIWGLVTVLLDKLHDIFEKELEGSPNRHALELIYKPISSSLTFPELSVLSLGAFALVFFIIAYFWIKFSSTSTNKTYAVEIKKWLGNDNGSGTNPHAISDTVLTPFVKDALANHSSVNRNSFFKRLNKILELIGLILPAVSLNRIDPLQGRAFISEIRAHLKLNS